MIRFLVIVLCITFSMAAFSKDRSKDKQRKSVSLPMLTVQQYKKLSVKKRNQYIKNIQATWQQFEVKYSKGTKVKSVWYENILWEIAFAADGKCIIGGKVFQTVDGKCPTRQSPCSVDGVSDGFECGNIFGAVCISRTPIDDLSKRCLEESGKSDKPIDYQLFSKELSADYAALCTDSPSRNTKDGCEFLKNKMVDAGVEATGDASIFSDSMGEAAAVATVPNRNYDVLSIIDDPNCPNEYDSADPETGVKRMMSLPKFSFDEDRQCLYDRNKVALQEIAATGCTKVSDKSDKLLFATRIRSLTNSDPKTQLYEDIIIENMQINKKEENSSRYEYEYTIQYIKPSTDKEVSRSNLVIKRTVFKTTTCSSVSLCYSGQFCNAENHCEEITRISPDGKEEKVKMYNVGRKLMIDMNDPGRVYESFLRSRPVIADNCRLSNALTQGGYYSTIPGRMNRSNDPIFNDGAEGTR